MKLTEFWVRAHQDERHEPSGPRLSGFITLIALLICVVVTLYGAFSGKKLVAETGIKLTSGLGLVVGVLYGATQFRSGLSGLFVSKPMNDGMPGQMPLQQAALPQMPIISSPLQSDPSTKAPQKPNISTVERWRERIARIIRVQDLVGKLKPQRESLKKIHKPLTPELEERLALAVETKPWEPRAKIPWRPQ